ncbi:MAG: YkgJ family cysteine cluster protein [Salinivirgaceae bacterium]|jgi:Fe-S-cluster containining protein|nr:YkgJ family cysteine cluster protein [Salinivirgaceae bacterium]
MTDKTITNYLTLRMDIDNAAKKLKQMHTANMVCKKGCDSCCESLTIFPIEFFTIQNETKKAILPSKKIAHKFTKVCRFLVKGECSIYESRPIICRTQGLPLLYESMNGEGFELSVCNLNFKGADVSKFTNKNALYMAPFNSRLYLLNKEFIKKSHTHKKPTKRIKLNML